MPGIVMRTIDTDVTIAPGDVQTYRLPPMSAGAFNFDVWRIADPPVSAPHTTETVPGKSPIGLLPSVNDPPARDDVSGVLITATVPSEIATKGNSTVGVGGGAAAGGRPVGTGGGGPGSGAPGPSFLLLDLLHGDTVVSSGVTLPLQDTISLRDESWRLRIRLNPTAPATERQGYHITLTYPSVLPVLTRRVPLSYLQQGFNDNWNGRKYISAEIEQNVLTLSIDQELATYYNLHDQHIELPIPIVTIENVLCDDVRLDVGFGPSPPGSVVAGDLPFIQIDVPVHSADGSHPITVAIPLAPDLTLANFFFRFKLYLMVVGHELTFQTVFESDLVEKLPSGVHGHLTLRQDVIQAAQKWMDGYGPAFGAILTTWFLGASYEPWELRHDKTSTQPDKFGLGDIVVDYIGLEQAASLTGNTSGPVAPALTDALLFNDPLYSPFPVGAGNFNWQPPQPASSATMPGGLLHQTTQGDLSKVDHIVVVMMENRSFDHMLGYLSRDGGRTDIEGLKNETGPNRTQFNYYNGRYYYPEHLSGTAIGLSPHHSHENVKGQMCDGMGHFVSDYARLAGDTPWSLRNAMGYYGAELQTYAMLAKQFAVCDHWFCSHVGPTIPNRFVTLTGDLNRDNYGQPEVDTPDFKTFTPCETATLFDHLTERGVTWTYFENRVSLMRAFTKYSFDMTNVRGFLDPVNGFAATVQGVNKIGAAGGLPSVTFIDPLFGDLPAGVFATMQDNDDAPPSDLQNGQAFIRNIVATLFSPSVNRNWKKTMLIVVYDEHGGFYDHVQPPDTAPPLLGQNSGKLGPRVPAFVVSAWTPAGKAINQQFEHASIAATILRRFCSPVPPSMGARVAAAADLRGTLSMPQPRDLSGLFPPPSLPNTQALVQRTPTRFRAPTRPDDFHAFLGGLSMTLGAAPQ